LPFISSAIDMADMVMRIEAIPPMQEQMAGQHRQTPATTAKAQMTSTRIGTIGANPGRPIHAFAFADARSPPARLWSVSAGED